MSKNCETYQNVDAGHGRLETRKALISHDVAWLDERHHWPGLRAIGKVVATREVGDKNLMPNSLLPHQRAALSRAFPVHHPRPLEYREQPSLGARRLHERGRRAQQKRQRTRKSLYPTAHRSQPRPLRTVKRINARKAENAPDGRIHSCSNSSEPRPNLKSDSPVFRAEEDRS